MSTYKPTQMAAAIATIGQAALEEKTASTVTSNGNVVITPTSGYDGMSEVTVPVNVNPNSSVEIVGTLANPWGNIAPTSLYNAIVAENATALLTVDATAIGYTDPIPMVCNPLASSISNAFFFEIIGFANSTASDWSAACADYAKTDGSLRGAYNLAGGTATDISAYASALTTTLSVIYHPLPTV